MKKLAIKVTPGARHNEIIGWEEDYPQVGRVLKVRIAAPPLEGKANKEIERFLAKSLSLPRGSVRILHGSTGRIKLVELPDNASLEALPS